MHATHGAKAYVITPQHPGTRQRLIQSEINLGDYNLALTLTIRHIHSFQQPTDQTFTDARYARSQSICYHTTAPRNMPKAHTVWVSDTTALRTTTVGAISKRSDSESNWIDILYRTLLA